MTLFSKVRATFQKPNLTTQVLPSFLVMALVLSARALGLLEPLDLMAFDIFLKLRPPEPPDDRITLIKITQEDVQRWGGYPIPNEKIVELVEELQPHQPTVIGLNLLGDLLPDNNQELISLFDKYENLVIAEKVLSPQILAPKGIHSNQVGFTDIQTDQDNHLRRVILGTNNPVKLDEFKMSFSIQLAQQYLSFYGYKLENGIQTTDAMRFGSTEIPLLEKNYGGYIGIDSGGIQTLLNYRQNSRPFHELLIQDIEQKSYSQSQIAQKIIIIGVIDPNTRGNIRLPAPFFPKNSTGVDIQGYTVSQIINAVLENRTLLKGHYKAEVIFGLMCILASYILIQRTNKNKFYIVSLLSGTSTIITYLGVILGYWISFASPILLFLSYGTLWFTINYFEKKNASIIKRKDEIQQESNLRKKTIQRIFSIIHNGPLQTLSHIIREAKNKEDVNLIEKLEKLDFEIRRISDLAENESLNFHKKFYLGTNESLDLELPLHELFYQLFNKTVERDLSEFNKIKVKVRSFEPFGNSSYENLNFEIKREICCFLEEMLCNVEKHAVGASKIKATGTVDSHKNIYILKIEDNGSSLDLTHQGEGTKQAEKLASRIKGGFSLSKLKSGWTRCELRWPLSLRRTKY